MWGPLATSRLRHSILASADRAPDSCPSLSAKLPYLIFSWGVGLVTFPSCLGLIQVLVFRPLRLTCAVWGSSLLGLCSVGTSGLAASAVTTACATYFSKMNTDSFRGTVCTHKYSGFRETALMYGVCSCIVFLCLGGRFRSVLPSSLVHPGAFARHGLAATFSYATTRKKKSLRATGKRHGCHTCGRRWFIQDFIADHQPPLAVIRERMMRKPKWYELFHKQYPKQTFYPQCTRCSDIQGAHLRTAIRAERILPKWRHIVTHPMALRLYHVYLPLPFLIPAIQSLLVMWSFFPNY
ncbi:uncharacterized protein LOC110983080 [Acanthaster planci]|uniref:Uncharacterized protein LOC110983080 n=1 Tax=Acanthaster planci TaxID=133434 RepID=A0A8B7YYG1_ACAPL|nr:uncharacterized protein LOC110983080 [Acanthaster planci]XP_022097708.1 uncharacterized protein LOC110983080 [Acanthaster planci]XP_022097717.1 uncharacterized protein LOC110983080 [Acanthaster planci]XP_022097727.1 uncharacterized protein LOC110983080 [Acanthaster planci]XP_022097737.1 uncharacterized protein LOC110983080 [Acanthaster planci]